MSAGELARRAWAELGRESDDLGRVVADVGAVGLGSALPVARLAVDSVAVASLALDLAGPAPARGRAPVTLDPARVRTAYTSERHLRIDGRSPEVWAPWSGFWETGDGWVRTHANYPHHARRLRELLALPGSAGTDDVAAAVSRWGALELEQAAAEHGALVTAVRAEAGWRALAATPASAPWIEQSAYDGAPAPTTRRAEPTAARPLRGLRVLDLTRVIAGPVAGRTLAAAGADVLRIDPPHLPEAQWQHLDTGHGKRSAFLDLARRDDRDRFDELAAHADVVLVGYSPAAVARLGLDPQTMAARFPSLVTGYVRAWSARGPWPGRRGFDSLVQAATGIAVLERAGTTDGRPGALPAQALDHSTGYLLAAAVVSTWVRGLRPDAGPRAASVSIALQRTAEVLLAARRPDAGHPPEAADAAGAAATTVVLDSPLGPVQTADAAVVVDGRPACYPAAAGVLGADAPTWDAPAGWRESDEGCHSVPLRADPPDGRLDP